MFCNNLSDKHIKLKKKNFTSLVSSGIFTGGLR